MVIDSSSRFNLVAEKLKSNHEEYSIEFIKAIQSIYVKLNS